MLCHTLEELCYQHDVHHFLEFWDSKDIHKIRTSTGNLEEYKLVHVTPEDCQW